MLVISSVSDDQLPDMPSNQPSLWRKALVPVCLCFTLFLFGPAELYLTNRQEFWFSFRSLLPYFIALFLSGSVLLTVILRVLPEKFSAAFYLILFAAAAGFYLEGNFLSRGYPLLTGDSIDWTVLLGKGILSTLVWLGIFAASFLLYRYKKNLFRTISFLLPAFILSIELVTLLTVALMQGSRVTKDSETCYFSSEHLYDFSEKKNIIVIVLDSFEGPRFESLLPELNQDPAASFPGFTFYPDTTGVGEYTVPSMTKLLTGSLFPVNVAQEDAFSQGFASAQIYGNLQNSGFISRLYTFDTFAVPSAIGKVENVKILSSDPQGGLRVTMTKQFFKLVCYRYMPHFMKRFFMRYGLVFDQEEAAFSDQYYANDLALWKLLDEKGVHAEGDTPLYALYHFNGMHSPYRMTRNKEYAAYTDDIPEEDRAKEQGFASLLMVLQFLDQLKQNGLYDTSAIIITADHGSQTRYRFSPLLLIKYPDNSAGFSVSDAPVSLNEQYLPLIEGLADGSISDRADFELLCSGQTVRRVYRYRFSDRWEGAASDVTEILVTGPSTELSSYSIDLFQ